MSAIGCSSTRKISLLLPFSIIVRNLTALTNLANAGAI
jgi:hypothetical protein